MATNTATGTVIAMAHWQGSLGSSDKWGSGYVTGGVTAVGFSDGGGVQYDSNTFLMKFKTPKFTGVLESIRFLFDWHIFSNTISHAGVKVRYALCKSDENKDMYIVPYETVEEEHQIITGTQDWALDESIDQDYELLVETRNLQPETEYYLFLWPRSAPCYMAYVNYTSQLAVEINYNVHSARIEIGAELKRCLCYVENGESWFPIAPNEDNGTGWGACS
jgi:hypothetical protein